MSRIDPKTRSMRGAFLWLIYKKIHIKKRIFLTKHCQTVAYKKSIWYNKQAWLIFIGVSPSGKATDSDSVIREFKSLHPSQKKQFDFCRVAFLLYRICGEIWWGRASKQGFFCKQVNYSYLVCLAACFSFFQKVLRYFLEALCRVSGFVCLRMLILQQSFKAN